MSSAFSVVVVVAVLLRGWLEPADVAVGRLPGIVGVIFIATSSRYLGGLLW